MLINVRDMWSENVALMHEIYVSNIINTEAKRRAPWGSKFLAEFVGRNSSAITSGGVDEIRASILDFEECCKARDVEWRRRSIKKFIRVLDYDRFSRVAGNGWGAYELCSRAKYKVCPYCQQCFAMTIVRDDGSRCFRPTLDHFYSKSEYPFLSLSLYNLIPSCYTCNSSLKGVRDFNKNKHLHPFESDEKIKFSVDISDYLEGKRTGYSAWKMSVLHDDLCKMQRNSMRTFAIKERYAFVAPLLDRFCERVYQHYFVGSGRYEQVMRGTLFDPESVSRLDFDSSNYKNELFGKVKMDVLEEFKKAAAKFGARRA